MTDREARFERLYERWSPEVAMYALRRSDRDTAQDVVAETFAVAWRRLDAVPRDPLPWLYAVARRVLANQRRSTARREALKTALARSTAGFAAPVDHDLADALRRLPSGDRELLTLVAWEGLSPREAAAALGCSDTACRLRLHRARRRLAALLDAAPAPTRLEEAR